jgi:hypothetical protein
MWLAEVGGLWFEASLSKKAQDYLKITQAKRTGGVAQVAEHLPNKCKPLSSIPSTTEKKKVT